MSDVRFGEGTGCVVGKHRYKLTVGVARPLIIRITIAGAFLALNCENQPMLVAPDDANLRHLNVRICEQGIGASG
jgi:hypothetical protein